jgi:hypothetical protein
MQAEDTVFLLSAPIANHKLIRVVQAIHFAPTL